MFWKVMNEFQIIKNFFTQQTVNRADVKKGIGDDCAIVSVPPLHQLAITTDTLIAGVHFPSETEPMDIGYKSLAVNLSDLAAMGAAPAWVTLALTLPDKNPKWLKSFCEGFFSLAAKFNVQLIGGDLTKGPLSITVQALGFLPNQHHLLRSNAKAGDLICVTGTLGDARLALKHSNQPFNLSAADHAYLYQRLNRPIPRIECSKAIINLAHAAIDVSDGLAADLTHILTASEVGAIIYVDQIPLSSTLRHHLSYDEAIHFALTGGDDYELCFTMPTSNKTELLHKFRSLNCNLTTIGVITDQPGFILSYQNGKPYNGPTQGYQHF